MECIKGDLFTTKADVKLIPVNVVGVMGAGLAKQFKLKYPKLYWQYRKDCERGVIKIGFPAIYLHEGVHYVMFPTKEHWRNPSCPSYISRGLDALVEMIGEPEGIDPKWTILSPALGCGYGLLDINTLREALLAFSSCIPNKVIFITPP